MAQLQSTGITGSLSILSGSSVEFLVTNIGVRIGNIITDAHTVTGSLSISGSLNATSSWATNAISASYALTASHALNAGGVAASNLIFSGSVSASVDVTSTQIFKLVSGSSTFMQVSSSGNVGIGTSTPSAKLQISGSTDSLVFDAYSSGFNGSYALLPGRTVVGTVTGGYPQFGYNFSTSGGVFTKIANDTAWNIALGESNLMQFRYAAAGTGVFSWNTAAVINLSGNVGIGTTTADARLRVDGGINATHSIFGNVSGRGLYIQTVTSSGTNDAGSILNARGGGAGTLIFQTEGTERARIAADGNVGIGTTPSAKFEIKSGAANNLGGLLLRATSTANFPAILYENSGNGGTLDLYNVASLTTKISSNGDSYFNGGNVGIGTTSFGSFVNLDVYRVNNASWAPRIVARDENFAAFMGAFNSRAGIFAHTSALNAWADLNVNTVNPSSSADSGRVLIGGSVGIGTSTLTGRVQINTGAASNNAITIQAASQTAITYGIGIDASSNLAIYDNFSSAQRVTINGSGNVGIGTTNPTFKLDVIGNTRIVTPGIGLYVYTSGSDFTQGIRVGDLSANNGYLYLTYVSQSRYGSLQAGDNIAYRNIAINHIGGNVGVGLTDPTGKLHISGSTNSMLRIESQDNSDTTPIVYIEGNKGGSSPATAVLIELKSNIDIRARGINMTTADSNARWFAGVSYNGGTTSGYQIGYDATTNKLPFYTESSSLFVSTTGQLKLNKYTTTSSFAGTVVGFLAFDANGNILTTGASGSGGGGSSQWTTNGLDIYYNTGNVGIGTTAPTGRLEVKRTISEYPLVLNSSHQNSASFTQYQINNSGGWEHGMAGLDNSFKYFFSYGAFGPATALFTIQNDGNVGIGTTAPSNKLQVVGTTRFVTTGSITTPIISLLQSNNADGYYFSIDNAVDGRMELRRLSDSSIIQSWYRTNLNSTFNSGSVGIGTTTPLSLLHISGTTGGVFEVDGASSVNALYVSASGNVGVGTTFPRSLLQISSSTLASVVQVDTAGGAGTLFVSGSGNVGIGTIFPTTKLDVSGTIALNGLSFARNNGNYHQLFEPAGNLALFLGNATDPGNYYDNTTHNFRSRGAGTTYVTITSAGRVGIGTTVAATQLHLSGSADIRMTNTANVSGFDIGLLGGSADANAYIYQRANSNIIFGTNNTEVIRITSAGSIGIGTTSPAVDVHISESLNGSAGFRAHNTNAGAGAFSVMQLGQQFGTTEAAQRFLNIGYASNGITEQGVYIPTGSFIVSYGNGGLNFLATGSGANIRFFISGSGGGGGREIMRIAEFGNVGIGETGPGVGVNWQGGTFLDVSGSIRASKSVILPVTGALPRNLPTGSIMSSGSGAQARPYYWNGQWIALF